MMMMMATPSPSASTRTEQKHGHHDADNSTTIACRKRRAPKACCACRMRKVRCNVFQHGLPCTNCRLDDVDCVVPQRRKGRSGGHLSPPKVQHNPQTEALPSESCLMEWENAEQFPAISSNNNLAVPQTVIRIADSEKDVTAQTPSPAAPKRCRSIDATAYRIPETSILGPERAFSRSAAHSIELPYFIRPLPSNIDSVDLEYLEKKGAFWLPDKPLVEELLRNYFEMIHPFTPIIDRDVISQLFECQVTVYEGQDARLSLFLMHAILFVSSAFIKESFLQGGYGIRANIRREFYLRAKMLYDFDLEKDPVAQLQGLLILTYWFCPHEPKNGWFWLEAAISTAQLMNLSSMVERCPAGRKSSLLKRLWWCCFIKENATHLELRKIPRLRLETCKVEPLTLADFGIQEVRNETGPNSQIQGFLGIDSGKERITAILCIEVAGLAVCLNRILSVRLSAAVLSRPDTLRACNTMILSKERAIITETKACEVQLREWRDKLRPEAQCREPQDNVETDAGVEMHRILMHMMYFAAMSTLYQAQGFPLTAQAPADAEQLRFHKLSQQKVCYSAQEITKLAEAAVHLQMTPYMPDFSVALLLPAIVVHLVRIHARQPESRREGFRGLGVCIELVEGLKQSCTAAHRVLRLLAPSLVKSGHSLAVPPPTSKQRPATVARTPTIASLSVSSTSLDFPFHDGLLSPATPGILHGEKPLDCTTVTPPASLDQLNPFSSYDSLTLDTKTVDKNSPTATQTLVQSPLPVCALDRRDAAGLFAGLDAMDWQGDALFGSWNSPSADFMNSTLDVDWAVSLPQ